METFRMPPMPRKDSKPFEMPPLPKRVPPSENRETEETEAKREEENDQAAE